MTSRKRRDVTTIALDHDPARDGARARGTPTASRGSRLADSPRNRAAGFAMLLLAAALASGCIGVSVDKSARPPGQGEPAAAPGALGVLEVVGDPEELAPRYGQRITRFEVTYTNNTSTTLRQVVVWCRAQDAEGYQLGAKRLELYDKAYGPMKPGFKTRLTLEWPSATVPASSRILCEIESGG